MAVRELVTRTFTGQHTEDGTPVYEVVLHGRPRPPESVAEWAEQRVAALGPCVGTSRAGRVTTGLLLADGDREVAAAVAAGRDLDVTGRWGVLKTLEQWREQARDGRDGYPPASSLADRLLKAWTAKWGSAEPRRAG